jgi:hypothetical protein
VDPVPDPLLLRKFRSSGNRTQYMVLNFSEFRKPFRPFNLLIQNSTAILIGLSLISCHIHQCSIVRFEVFDGGDYEE